MKFDLRIFWQVFYAVVVAGFFVSMVTNTACAQEMRLFDETFTATEAEHGFHYFKADTTSSANWLKPFNYYEGTFHFRYEIIDYPGTEPFMLSVCIWSDVKLSPTKSWESWSETCPPRLPVSGRGIFTTHTSPATWWQINKDKPVDFGRVGDFATLGVVHWCANDKNLSDWVPAGKGCWPERNHLLPMKMRVTVIAVAKGYEFSGWE